MTVPASSSTLSDRVPSLPRVSFQGAPGAFSELAIRGIWPNGAVPVPQPTFEDAVQCALSGNADFAVIPVENVIAGPVKPALDVLERSRHRFTQCGEFRLNVQMCFMALAGAQIADLRVVLSHPMALAQCNHFFATHHWLTPVVHNDTASAAAEVARGELLNAAALASETAAEQYGLEILARDVQDIRDNWTRFVVVKANV
ncbi:MAG: prephenate dehydratase domain-containing protein [Gemmatimonas sp.]